MEDDPLANMQARANQCRRLADFISSGPKISKPTFDASKTGWRGMMRVDRR
jgi:hypothetical protein